MVSKNRYVIHRYGLAWTTWTCLCVNSWFIGKFSGWNCLSKFYYVLSSLGAKSWIPLGTFFRKDLILAYDSPTILIKIKCGSRRVFSGHLFLVVRRFVQTNLCWYCRIISMGAVTLYNFDKHFQSENFTNFSTKEALSTLTSSRCSRQTLLQVCEFHIFFTRHLLIIKRKHKHTLKH